MSALNLYVGNDCLIELIGLTNETTGAYINNATVQVWLKDSDDAAPSGAAWPITLDYVAASNGDYRATLVDTLGLTVDEVYYITLDADGGDGLKGHWEDVPVTAMKRTS